MYIYIQLLNASMRGVYLSMEIRMLCRAAIRYSQEAEGSDALNDDTFGDVARPAGVSKIKGADMHIIYENFCLCLPWYGMKSLLHEHSL